MRILNGFSPRGRKRLGTAAAIAFLVVLFALYFTTAITGEQSTYVSGDPSGGRVQQPQRDTPPANVAPAPAPVDQTMVHEEEVADPNEIHWTENGELTTPAPQDPDVRALAVEQMRAAAMGQAMGRAPDAQYAPTPDPQMPQPHHGSTFDIPSRAGETFSVEDVENEGTFNLKLPDKFHPTLEELQAEGIDVTEDEGALAPMASALIQDFGGIDQTTLSPPDPDIAAGPNHVVIVVNSRFAFYDKCGNNLYENNFATFVGNSTEFFFDPKVIYDRWDQRWIMTICVRNNTTHASYVMLMISDDNNPVGSWCWYYFSYGSTYWADYQDVGTYTDGVVITANMFDWSSPSRIFQYAHVRMIETADLLACAAASSVIWTGMTNPHDATLAFSIRPSDQMSWGADYWMVNSVSYGGNFLTLWSINGGYASPSLLSWDIPVGYTYDDPPPLLQGNGTYVDCGDARLLCSSYYSGDLYTSHGRRYNWGEPTDRSVITVYQIGTVAKTLDYTASTGASGYYYAYPAVDLDTSTERDGVVTFSRGGPTEYVGTRYINLPKGGPFSVTGSSPLVAGQAYYAGGGTAGTFADPYRWGDYYGCDLDAFDNRTLWFFGQFASNSPTPSWDTHVGATSIDGPGVLTITPSTPFVTYGLQGGPFTPPSVMYTLENTGGTALTWGLTGVTSWETPSLAGAQLKQGLTQNVTMTINANANTLAPAAYTDYYYFTNCYNGSQVQRTTQLTVGIDGSCPGSIVELTPGTPPDNVDASSSYENRGLYITAIKDFEVCAIGWQAELSLPQTLTARIYEANGLTRGALLAQNSVYAVQPGEIVHYIPINYTLQACQEYDIAVEFEVATKWDWWNENTLPEPFDAGGVIRVRDAEYSGGAGNYALPAYTILGSEPACEDAADLGPPTPPDYVASDDYNQRGIYVTAKQTISLCSFGWRADLVVPQTLTARVYEATGTTRGAQIAEGTLEVAMTGDRWHDVPINVTLVEGHDYDITMEWDMANSWDWWDDRPLMPNSTGPFDNIDGESSGGASNFALPHFRVAFAEPVDGAQFDLAKLNGTYPGDYTSSQDNYDYGMYVTSLIDQEVYAVGWYADVPLGASIGARIYNASGTTRGTLISEGTLLSSGSGLRWHDVPVAASLVASGEYDIEIDIGQVDEWHAWSDASGLPYDAYGVMRVRDGEQGGSAGNVYLLHIRYNGCNPTATAVADNGPERAPMYLAPPAPNPISNSAKITFGLERNEAVTITVYDVAGRRVATLVDGERRPMGLNTVDLDAGNLPSGVYFVKLSTKLKSMTRKFVVTH
jgi:hypothetical protein